MLSSIVSVSRCCSASSPSSRSRIAASERDPRDDAVRAPRERPEHSARVAAIDRLSLERKVPPGPAVWRAALEVVLGPDEPRLL